MRNSSPRVQPLFGLVRQAQRTSGVGFAVGISALLLLGCSGQSEIVGTGGAGHSSADTAGSTSSSGGSGARSFGGEGATAGLTGPASGAGGSSGANTYGGAGAGVIAGAGRAGGLGRGGSGGGTSVNGTSLGIACTSQAQCGAGMVCATANGTLFGLGGPSQGMCTMACTPGGNECDTLKAGADCFDFGTVAAPQGYCLDACVQGDSADVLSKCAGRSDFVCTDLGSNTVLPFCVPHCRSDAECGAGLFCDKRSLLGLCSTTKPPTGDPVGTPCTPDAATDTCEGYCIRTSAGGATPVTGACVELCSGGTECMYSSGSSPTPGGFCGGSLTGTFGELDLGYCLANCSCTTNCKLPGDLCRKWPAADADLVAALGAPGVCYSSVVQSVELTTCGNGGAGSGGASGASGASGAGASAGGAGAAGTPIQTAGASGSGL